MKRFQALAFAAMGFSVPGFFSDLHKLGLTVGYYQTAMERSFLPGLRYSSFVKAPLKEVDGCHAVFCRDVELQERLNAEVRRGRLVLVTDTSNGFIAAVPTDNDETKAIKREVSPSAEAGKNLLIVTPKTLLSTIVHELTHAEDHEKNHLKPFFEQTKRLFEQGHLAAFNGQKINQFLGEIRAYDNEMRYILKNSRKVEYLADDAPTGGPSEVVVRTTFKMDFVSQRIREIDWKVRDWYLPEFLKALKDEKLPVAAKTALLDQVRDLMPQEGPYSYRHLVQPKL